MIFDRLLLGWSASAHRSWSREKQYQYSFVADDTLHVGDESNGGEGEGTDLEDSRCVGMRSQHRPRFDRLQKG